MESECLLNEALDHIFQITVERLSLKDEQKEAVSSLLSGKDVLAVLPTGFGKSLFSASFPPVFFNNLNNPPKNKATASQDIVILNYTLFWLCF